MRSETAQQIGRWLVPIIAIWLGYKMAKKHFNKQKGGGKDGE